MNDEDRKLSEGVDALLADRPLRHDCENCGEAGMAAICKLPPGWRYLTVSAELVSSLDEADKKTIIVCAICFGLITRVIKKLIPR